MAGTKREDCTPDTLSDVRSKATVGAYQRRSERTRVSLGDIRRWRQHSLVTDAILPLTHYAEDECRAIFEALGGLDNVSEMERALVEDFARVGVVLQAELARFVNGDRDAGRMVGTMATIRRASLVALGLQRRAKELGLEDYIEAKAVKVNGSDDAG